MKGQWTRAHEPRICLASGGGGWEGGEERERNQQENAKDLSNENQTILNTRLHPNQPYRTNGDVREHVVRKGLLPLSPKGRLSFILRKEMPENAKKHSLNKNAERSKNVQRSAHPMKNEGNAISRRKRYFFFLADSN